MSNTIKYISFDSKRQRLYRLRATEQLQHVTGQTAPYDLVRSKTSDGQQPRNFPLHHVLVGVRHRRGVLRLDQRYEHRRLNVDHLRVGK